MSRRLGTIVQSQAHAERFNVEAPTAADIRTHLHAHPELTLEVLRSLKVASPWMGGHRYAWTCGTTNQHACTAVAFVNPAWQSPQDIGGRAPRRWSWCVVEKDAPVLGHGEADTEEEAQAAADAVLTEHGWALAVNSAAPSEQP